MFRKLPVFVSFLLSFHTVVFAGNLEYETFSQDDAGLLFTIHGSNTIGAHLAPAWALAYLSAKGASNTVIQQLQLDNEYRIAGTTEHDKAVYIDIAAHGSSTGFVGLENGKANIAMSSRAIKDGEVQKLRHLGDMRSFAAEQVVAIDGLAIIVNKNNPLNALTVDTIGKIFSGEISNWRSINGVNRPINIYARDNNSGTWDTFNSLVLRDQYTLSSKAERFESNDELSDRVAIDESGIGFVGLASVRQAKLLAVSDGDSRPLKPHALYVATEDYPLSRRLFMYTPTTQSNAWVSEFLSFAQSDSGQTRVKDIGFIAQTPMSVPAEPDNAAPRDYLAITEHAERLSINFRFGEGSAELDNKARRDVLRLTEYLKRPENTNKHIQLIGFSDQKDQREREMILSRMRALMVQIALFKQGISTETVVGFGGGLPVAENSGNSRLRNRRVEVWLYEPEVHQQVLAAKRQAELNEEKLSDASFSAPTLTATR